MAAGTPIKTWVKDPAAILDYALSWVRWLGPYDTIVSAVVTVPAGLTSLGTYTSAGYVMVWLTGGTVGTIYSIYITITTATGRVDKRTFAVSVAER